MLNMVRYQCNKVTPHVPNARLIPYHIYAPFKTKAYQYHYRTHKTIKMCFRDFIVGDGIFDNGYNL